MSHRRVGAIARHLVGSGGVAAAAAESADDILAAHYAANPHVAAQLKTTRPLQSLAAPTLQSLPATSGSSADDILAAHYAANPHVAAQLKTQRDVTAAAPQTLPATSGSSADDILAAHYAANPHVAAQLKTKRDVTAAAPQTLPATSGSSADDILAAHYAANPHVAAQLKTKRDVTAAAPQTLPATSGSSADDILAAHYAANPHVAAQLKTKRDVTAAAPQTLPATSGSSADDILAAHYAANPHVAAQLKTKRDVAVASTTGITTGQGDFRFEYAPELLQLPAGVDIQHAHSLCTDTLGRIYLTYTSNSVDGDTHAVARFSPDGRSCELLGVPGPSGLASGTPHGIRHSVEDGEEYLYHANNGMLHKSTIDGDIVWSNTEKLVWPGMAYAPTDCLVIPGDDRLFVADGYGSSFVHVVDRRNGQYIGTSWGGKGDTADPSEPTRFDCNHGMGYDEQSGCLVFTDRANSRLVYSDPTGQFVKETPLGDGGLSLPCNVDVKGDYAITASLGDGNGMSNGEVGIVDQRTNKVVSILEIAKLLSTGPGEGHAHPHDAIFLPNGDVVVGTWNPGNLSYWRRV